MFVQDNTYFQPTTHPVCEYFVNTSATPRDALVHVIKSWLDRYNNQIISSLFPLSSHTIPSSIQEQQINSFIDIIITVLSNFNMPSYMIFPVVLYANKYVQAQGIKLDQLFHLLLASTMTTIKYWDDSPSGVNKIVSITFNYSIESVNLVERTFLEGIGWNLTLHWEEVEYLTAQIIEYLNSRSHPPVVYLPISNNTYIVPNVHCFVTNS